MDKSVIEMCTTQSLLGKMSFPEVVMRYSAAGVERYLCDLITQKKHSYGLKDEVHQQDMTFEQTPVPKNFHVTNIQQAIIDIAQEKISYKTFLQRIMQAGCTHYEVFIQGQRAVYFGRRGELHIEEFPKGNE